MTFEYSLKHIDLSKLHNKVDLLILLKNHDYNSFIYSLRTAQITYAICSEMKMSKKDLEINFLCGLFHDIGKLGMSKDFINYPSSYTIEMYEQMKNHPQGGAYLLSYVHAEPELINNSNYHHCNYDGSGYPGGLYEKEIPIHPRLTRISDSIDAYLTKRCYKEGGPAKGVLDDLMQFTETSYDPELLDYFAIVHRKTMRICHRHGHDRPSQDVYMYYLNSIYNPENIYPEFLKKLLTND
jgi:putative nucleotidyltransferase with HDIG domain